jgi:hypothetical protein
MTLEGIIRAMHTPLEAVAARFGRACFFTPQFFDGVRIVSVAVWFIPDIFRCTSKSLPSSLLASANPVIDYPDGLRVLSAGYAQHVHYFSKNWYDYFVVEIAALLISFFLIIAIWAAFIIF